MLDDMALLEQVCNSIAWARIEGKIFVISDNDKCYCYDGKSIVSSPVVKNRWLRVQSDLWFLGIISDEDLARYFEFSRVDRGYDVWVAKDLEFGRLEIWNVNGEWEVHRETI